MIRNPSQKVPKLLTLTMITALTLFGCSLFGLGEEAGTSTDSGNQSPPPWLAADPATCQLTETSAQSRGDPHSYDSAGNSTGLLPQGQVTCVLEIQACADMIVKQKVVNTSAGEKCPVYLHYSYAPTTQVCCAAWNEAKESKSPCDPLEDMDCDGVANDLDQYPLDFLKP